MADSTDRVGSSTFHERGSIWREHFGKAVALAFGAAAAGVVGGYLVLRILSTGDEAPIRVKNGSIDLHLLSIGATWRATGNHYTTGGSRQHDTYQIRVVAQGCPVKGAGKNIRLIHSNDHFVELDATGNHTKVTSDDLTNLKIDPSDPQMLRYAVSGFIKSITVDGTVVCTLTTATDLDDINFLDY